jgi:major vault protein
MIKANVRKLSIEEFYARSEDFVRDVILGAKGESGSREGRLFRENGMRVVDVEVLNVQVGDERIAALLSEAQRSAVESNIALGKAEKELLVAKRTEQIERERAEAEAETAKRKAELETDTVDRALSLSLARLVAEIEEKKKRLDAQHASDAVSSAAVGAALDRAKHEMEQNLEFDRARQAVEQASLEAHTRAVVDRFGAAQEGFSEAVLALSNQETLSKVAEAMSVQNLVGGKSFAEVVSKVFQDTPLAQLLTNVQNKSTPKLGSKKNG